MNRQLKLFYIMLILLCISLICIPKFGQQTVSDSKRINQSEEIRFYLRIYDNTLCLFENDTIIKKYDINPLVLPSDDIYLLTNGIEVKDISEADSVAENFDG